MAIRGVFSSSLHLDHELLRRGYGLSFGECLDLIARKYGTFLLHRFLGRGPSHLESLSSCFHFLDGFGPASLQRIVCGTGFFREVLAKGGSVLDVGANIGHFAYVCHHLLGAGRHLN